MNATPTALDPHCSAPSSCSRLWRIEVFTCPGRPDPRGEQLAGQARQLGYAIDKAASTRIYLIEAPISQTQAQQLGQTLLADPVIESFALGVHDGPDGAVSVEVHPLPGVMDPAAQSVANAAAELLWPDHSASTPAVSTGWRYDLLGPDAHKAGEIAARVLANPVVHAIHTEPFCPEHLPAGHSTDFTLRHIPLLDLDDAALEALSRRAHLFLSLEEMRTLQAHFQSLNREPTDIELETIAQTWSEHCVHKTLKSTIRYTPDIAHHGVLIPGLDVDTPDATRTGFTRHPDGSVTIDNLLKRTVAAATFQLIEEGLDWTLSVFVDNAGIIAFDEHHALCMKVETHNHPSALEPYGGSATGIGGCIRDIIGTGLAAKPIANTDVFCVAHPNTTDVPAGCIHPRRTLQQVVAGVRDYGNRMGIPTINGSVAFDQRFIGNPLVFCGCVGIMPTNRIAGEPQHGDLIVALGGRTGRDGIHGATFSSAELTDTHADEFSHAVQIGNAIEEKRTLDAILRARDYANGPLYHAITDCGAGGFSSAIGEMGEHIGARVELDKAPLKYEGLTYTEIWISEAQERMVLAVPAENLDTLQAICDEEHVQLAVLGTFGTDNNELVLTYQGTRVGQLSMDFLHNGLPQPTRNACWNPQHNDVPEQPDTTQPTNISPGEALMALLAHPTIASKHWIINQYDHEVQGNTVLKPLVGPCERGPGDAAVIEPVPGTGRGVAIACGLALELSDPARGGDPYLGALAAIDECVRNLVCVGANPDRIAILDNFCWPGCDKPENLGSLVRAAVGCHDGALAYRTPFVSGKDSLNNQFTIPATDHTPARTIEIPPTLLISGLGVVDDVAQCITMDVKNAGRLLVCLQAQPDQASRLGGSIYASMFGRHDNQHDSMPVIEPHLCAQTARAVAAAINAGLVHSCHDCSDGGLLVAIVEMLIAAADSGLGLALSPDLPNDPAFLFGQMAGQYVLEIDADDRDRLTQIIARLAPHAKLTTLGMLDTTAMLRCSSVGLDVSVEQLTSAWRSTLDW